MNRLYALLSFSLMCLITNSYAMEQEIQSNNNQSINVALIEAIQSANVFGVQAAINLGADVNYYHREKKQEAEKSPLAYAIDLYFEEKIKKNGQGHPIRNDAGVIQTEYIHQDESLTIIEILLKNNIKSDIVQKDLWQTMPRNYHTLYYALRNPISFRICDTTYWPLIEKLISYPLFYQPEKGRDVFSNGHWYVDENAQKYVYKKLWRVWKLNDEQSEKECSDLARVYYHLNSTLSRLIKDDGTFTLDKALERFSEIVPELYELGPRSFFKVPFTLEEIKTYLCDGTLQHIINAIPQTKNKMPQKLKFRELGINYQPQQQKESNTEITQNDTIGADTNPSTEKKPEFSLEQSLSFEPVTFKKSAKQIKPVNFELENSKK